MSRVSHREMIVLVLSSVLPSSLAETPFTGSTSARVAPTGPCDTEHVGAVSPPLSEEYFRVRSSVSGAVRPEPRHQRDHYSTLVPYPVLLDPGTGTRPATYSHPTPVSFRDTPPGGVPSRLPDLWVGTPSVLTTMSASVTTGS